MADTTPLSFQDLILTLQHYWSEKGCAILAAIEEGALAEQRYNNYVKMKNETAFYEMSYSEKRKKDKAFGKLIKATLKSKNR